ncbi:hypothetical protein QWZ10_25140 [Paracoccus cavernae]|uniref:Glycosyltransferase n=1 Tax=Paracoccus cavernae TaxID=1571207 RepID=A0ABT8DF02_9RHOB|nr:hypothetical protein [Paracoccus cavernae]
MTELWSAGVPALVFDFPTVAGRVRASGAGWILPHQDIEQLYRKLLKLRLILLNRIALIWRLQPGRAGQEWRNRPGLWLRAI